MVQFFKHSHIALSVLASALALSLFVAPAQAQERTVKIYGFGAKATPEAAFR